MIDAEKLEEAIAKTRMPAYIMGPGVADVAGGPWLRVDAADLALLRKAAEHTLATLPRYKEVEVVQWAVCDEHDVFRVFDHEEAAQSYALDCCSTGLAVVRLTGTAKVKVTS